MRASRLAVVLLAGATAMLCAVLMAPAVSAAPGPPDAPEWWVDQWGVHSLWAGGADGRGIVIGEIDSGVNASIPQLAGKILPGTDFGPLGGDGHTDREVDPFGHGTAMASIMVASSGIFGIEGLAPAAQILPVAIPLIGTQDATGNDHLAEAIRWAADHGAKIISMSLGASRDQATDPLACPADEQAAIYYALSKGDILVAAAGNNGPSDNDVEEPSVCIGIVTVGAIDSTGTVASFSSRSSSMTVTAPGVNIPSLGRIAGQAYNGRGTSQAAALTSASLALIWSKYPTLTGRQVLARLLATLDKTHNPADPAYGYGQINAAAAVNTNVPADAPNVVFAAADPFLARLNPPAASPAPAPATTAETPPGTYSAASPPSDLTTEVWLAAAASLAGLIGLLLLLGFSIRGRRRRFVPISYSAPLPAWSGPADLANPAMPWRDLVEPPGWAPPAEPPSWTAPPDQEPVVYPPASLREVPTPEPAWRPPEGSEPFSAGEPPDSPH